MEHLEPVGSHETNPFAEQDSPLSETKGEIVSDHTAIPQQTSESELDDHSTKAAKLAMRVSQLPEGIHTITLVKRDDVWSWRIDGDGENDKVEVAR